MYVHDWVSACSCFYFLLLLLFFYFILAVCFLSYGCLCPQSPCNERAFFFSNTYMHAYTTISIRHTHTHTQYTTDLHLYTSKRANNFPFRFQRYVFTLIFWRLELDRKKKVNWTKNQQKVHNTTQWMFSALKLTNAWVHVSSMCMCEFPWRKCSKLIIILNEKIMRHFSICIVCESKSSKISQFDLNYSMLLQNCHIQMQ